MVYTIHPNAGAVGDAVVSEAEIRPLIDELSGRPGISLYIMSQPLRIKGSAYVAVRRGHVSPYRNGFIVKQHPSIPTAKLACQISDS